MVCVDHVRDDNGPVQKSDWGQGEYLNPVFTRHIDQKRVEIILEVGSRDAVDALELSRYYGTHVYAFECNPEAISICHGNIKDDPNVSLVQLACWNTTGKIPFYPVVVSVDRQQSVNIGASSCLKINPEGIDRNSLQTELVVPATRLDDWLEAQELDHIELLCLDVQGATLQVLSGLGKYIQRTGYIITEGYHQPGYLGEALAPEIYAYLSDQGFKLMAGVGDEFISNALFARA